MGEIMISVLLHVASPEQAEVMRVIRNTCREFMTNDRSEISVERQLEWFQSIKDDPFTVPFLFRPDGFEAPIGYGLLRSVEHKLEARWWLSGGLLPEWRGKGYGKVLFGELARLVHQLKQPAWLTVWEDNKPAVRTYESLGFVAESVFVDAHMPPVLFMKLDPPP
jgi:ribosomal protein S18 acetylase RimI-like enzyme